MEPINVFGGTGFVGSAYVRALEHNYILNDRNDYVPKANNILYFISTTDNYNVHTNLHIDIDTNLTVLMNVLENIPVHKRSDYTFNFVSSWFVYGDTDLPAVETSVCNPKGFYSITKRAAEQLLISYCETFGMKYRILRLANVAGPGDKNASAKKNALAYLIKQLKAGAPIELYDGGQFIRDYIHIEDCVRAINLVITSGDVNTIYNIGNGVPILFKDLIYTAKELLNSNSNIISIPQKQFHSVVQVKSMYMDNTKLLTLGYQQQFNMYDILISLFRSTPQP